MEKGIALFGTSADPPTIGHKKILEELSKIYASTICYVSNNPNKKHKEDIAIRSQLLKTLIEHLDDHKILFNQSVTSKWAVESIKKCKKIYVVKNLWVTKSHILDHNRWFYKRSFASYKYLFCC